MHLKKHRGVILSAFNKKKRRKTKKERGLEDEFQSFRNSKLIKERKKMIKERDEDN